MYEEMKIYSPSSRLPVISHCRLTLEILNDLRLINTIRVFPHLLFIRLGESVYL